MASQGAAQSDRASIEAYWDGRIDVPPYAPAIAELRGRGDACELCALALRAWLPSFGAIDRRAWLDAMQTLARNDADRARLEVAKAWSRLAEGSCAAAIEGFARGAAACRELSIVDGYLEAGAGHALSLLEADRIDDGVARARQLARSARSESLANLEVLAYLALARARRMSGSLELAVHVLRAIAPLAPKPWQRWIAWERELAGARIAPPGEIARSLATIDSGASVAIVIGELRRAVEHVAPLEADALDLGCALDAGQGDASPAMRAFLDGQRTSVPRGLHAIGAGANDDLAYVLAAPDHPPRRVLARALRADRIAPDRTPQLRTHSLLARLAWIAPAAADEEEIFRELYGFAYDRVRHKQLFDTLVHRARTKAGPHATLERGGGRLRLALARPVLVWDPAVRRSSEDRILAHLAGHGSSSARDVAAALTLPLRTVQALLRELTACEGCLAHRDGRNVVYAIEDTCFSELTRQRFLALHA